MSQLDKEYALKKLLKRGPFVETGNTYDKYGRGTKQCFVCSEVEPFHREYCAWEDYFATERYGDQVTEEEWLAAGQYTPVDPRSS